MVNFDYLSFNAGNDLQLSKLHIDFVFQPIYNLHSMKIEGYEALMRPLGTTPTDLIDEYECTNHLHILELASFFGATKEFLDRKLPGKLCINSFANELLTQDEIELYLKLFPEITKGRLVVEMLDHFDYAPLTWQMKREQCHNNHAHIAIDDFDMHKENFLSVNVFEPEYIKLDRCYIENITTNLDALKKLISLTNYLHKMGIKIVAEGIETKEEFNIITSVGIDYGQGFYLGIPE